MSNVELTNKRNELAAARRRKAAIKNTINNLKKSIDELESAPRLPRPTGTMIQFDKRFLRNGPTYKYIAIEVNGRWYLTGPTSPQNISWDRLADFIQQDNFAPIKYTPLIKAAPVGAS